MKRLLAYLPTLTVLVGITYVSLLRTPSFALPPIASADKVAHILMYAALACAFVWDSWRVRPGIWQHTRWMAVAFGCIVLYGGLIELLQKYCFYPRTGTWGDWLADALGCGVGILLYLLLCARTRKN